MEKRLNEILERKNAIKEEIVTADEERMNALEAEVSELEAEEVQLRKKMDIQSRIKLEEPIKMENITNVEERAAKFAASGNMKLDARSLLISGGTIALATKVEGTINDIYGPQVSSLVDMVNVVDCTGMGTHRVPYVEAGMTAYSETEGSAGTASDVTFGYVDLTPNDFDALAFVSKQIAKQSPLMYEQKVASEARKALRSKASKAIVDAIVASSLADSVTFTSATIDGKTLRKIVFGFGGNEGIGAGTLVLNKKDLIAFGDVRGTNEKKAVYEITPDAADPNRGTIRDGGLVVPYIINNNCVALSECTNEDATTMLYGDLKAVELDLWGGVEVKISEDYKFAEGLLTVRGETLCDADLVVKGGFVKVVFDYTAPST